MILLVIAWGVMAIIDVKHKSKIEKEKMELLRKQSKQLERYKAVTNLYINESTTCFDFLKSKGLLGEYQMYYERFAADTIINLDTFSRPSVQVLKSNIQ